MSVAERAGRHRKPQAHLKPPLTEDTVLRGSYLREARSWVACTRTHALQLTRVSFVAHATAELRVTLYHPHTTRRHQPEPSGVMLERAEDENVALTPAHAKGLSSGRFSERIWFHTAIPSRMNLVGV